MTYGFDREVCLQKLKKHQRMVLFTLNRQSTPTNIPSNKNGYVMASPEGNLQYAWKSILNPTKYNRSKFDNDSENISMEGSEKRIINFCLIIATLMFLTITAMLLSFPIILIEHKPKIMVPNGSEKNLFCKQIWLLGSPYVHF